MKTKITITILSAITGGVFSEVIETFLNDKWQFIAILIVVAFDFGIGVLKAIADEIGFRTDKFLKTLIKLVLFWCLLGTVLFLEKGFSYASFLSEAIMLPILVISLLKSIKKMTQLGYIDSETFTKIGANIDKHKEVKPAKREKNPSEFI